MRLSAVALGTLMGFLLSAEACVGLMLNPLDRSGKVAASSEDWFQPGTGAVLVVTSLTALTGFLTALRREQQKSEMRLDALRAFVDRSGRRASLIFATYFALFTYWSFAWTDTPSPLWLVVWFTVAFVLTMAACRGATWAALRSHPVLKPPSDSGVG
jgi:hypothetical protein